MIFIGFLLGSAPVDELQLPPVEQKDKGKSVMLGPQVQFEPKWTCSHMQNLLDASTCVQTETHKTTTGGQMSPQTTLINPDQTSGMLSQYCHSVKEGQE